MNFRKSAKAIAAIGLTALLPFSANATDLGGTASASISQIITITENTLMSFGTIAVNGVTDTVTLSVLGVPTAGAQPYQFSGAPASGNFTATGDANAAIAITFSTGDTLTGPGAAMPLNNFTHDAGGTPALSAGGSLVFNTGADLVVGTSQATGAYSGGYTVTVNYN